MIIPTKNVITKTFPKLTSIDPSFFFVIIVIAFVVY